MGSERFTSGRFCSFQGAVGSGSPEHSWERCLYSWSVRNLHLAPPSAWSPCPSLHARALARELAPPAPRCSRPASLPAQYEPMLASPARSTRSSLHAPRGGAAGPIFLGWWPRRARHASAVVHPGLQLHRHKPGTANVLAAGAREVVRRAHGHEEDVRRVDWAP